MAGAVVVGSSKPTEASFSHSLTRWQSRRSGLRPPLATLMPDRPTLFVTADQPDKLMQEKENTALVCMAAATQAMVGNACPDRYVTLSDWV